MHEEEFIKAFTEVIDMEEPLMPEDVLKNLKGWDSLATLSLIAMLDEEYGVSIGSKEIEKMITVQDLIDFIRQNKKS